MSCLHLMSLFLFRFSSDLSLFYRTLTASHKPISLSRNFSQNFLNYLYHYFTTGYPTINHRNKPISTINLPLTQKFPSINDPNITHILDQYFKCRVKFFTLTAEILGLLKYYLLECVFPLQILNGHKNMHDFINRIEKIES